MAHYPDLNSCDYFGDEHTRQLLAVGWLSAAEPFPVGTTDLRVYETLKALFRDAWQPMVFGGIHTCELCQFDGPVGSSNLFVPNGTVIFVCPELVAHYISAHHYRPPDEFLSAVMNCPNTRTIQYKKLLLQSGGRTLASR